MMMSKKLMWKRLKSSSVPAFCRPTVLKSFFLLNLVMVASCAHHHDLVIVHSREKLFPLQSTAVDSGIKRQVFNSMANRKPVSVAATGDLMMGSWIVDLVEEKGFDYPFDSTRSIFRHSDITIANLEAPLTDAGNRFEDKTFTFKVPPDFVKGIDNAGINVVNLANNHIVDYGCEGLSSTIAVLEDFDIAYCGAGANDTLACRAIFLEKEGIRFAFLGFSFTYPLDFWAENDRCGTCHPTEAQMRELIDDVDERADIIVVSFHWGQEKRSTPKSYQTYFAHRAIDFGADLVLGHHPHVLQGIEIYHNRLIAYSLGNYIFGSFSYTARTSMILRVFVDKLGLVYARVYPINVYNSAVQFQPRLLRGEQRERVLRNLNKISTDLNQGKTVVDMDGFVAIDPFY
ncbi:CapA family protein [candidate division KSB1 bacterium]|nr:CapA family protein [candidate division KSB1 bacterium]